MNGRDLACCWHSRDRGAALFGVAEVLGKSGRGDCPDVPGKEPKDEVDHVRNHDGVDV